MNFSIQKIYPSATVWSLVNEFSTRLVGTHSKGFQKYILVGPGNNRSFSQPFLARPNTVFTEKATCVPILQAVC